MALLRGHITFLWWFWLVVCITLVRLKDIPGDMGDISADSVDWGDMGDIGPGTGGDEGGWEVDNGGEGDAWDALAGEETAGIGEEGGALHLCLERPKEGPCEGSSKRWYFDDNHGDCKLFKHGECAKENNFKSKQACRKGCSEFLDLKPCICTASSHYLTFDGVELDHQGKCKYTVTRSKNRKDECAFEIQMKNYPKKGSRHITWVRMVDIKFKGHLIRMGPGDHLKVDKVERDIPVTSIEGLIIECNGPWLETKSEHCGFSVLFNMEDTAKISLDRTKWGNKVFGMCGNCDEVKKNDWNVREGFYVGGRKHKTALVGDSYLIPDDSDRPVEHCKSKFYHPKCPKHVSHLIGSKYYCGKIIDKNGPFKECIESGEVDYKTYYRMCGYDVCAYAEQRPYRYPKEPICRALTNFADACAQAKFISPKGWRSLKFCKLKCPRNMHFNPMASGCPNTCKDRNASRNCRKPQIEACQCNKGYYLDGPNRCVKPSKCGCVDKKGDYHRLGAQWLGRKCKKLMSCVRSRGKSVITWKKISCDPNAECRVKRGKRVCKCIQPFVGNGIMCRRHCPSVDGCLAMKRCKYGLRVDCGCEICECAKCPKFHCKKYCIFGHTRDEHGCRTCKCNKLCGRPTCNKHCPKGRKWIRHKRRPCYYCKCNKKYDPHIYG